MAATYCGRCKVAWASYVDVCRICMDKDQMVYKRDLEPSTHQQLKAAEEKIKLQQEQADVDTQPADRVFNWRFEELLEAGAPPQIADMIAAWEHVDLHRACQMLRAGCDPALAQQILNPDN